MIRFTHEGLTHIEECNNDGDRTDADTIEALLEELRALRLVERAARANLRVCAPRAFAYLGWAEERALIKALAPLEDAPDLTP
jgi:hypothetical protein